MDISIVSTALSASTISAAPPSVTVLPADELATVQFASMMEAPTATAGVDPAVVTNTSAVLLPVQAPTMGEQILNGLQNVSSDLRQSIGDVSAALNSSEELSVSDLLKAQMGLMQVSVTYELVGKGISKSTQNLDQLVKMQ